MNDMILAGILGGVVGWCGFGALLMAKAVREKRDERMRRKGQREVMRELYRAVREDGNRCVFRENGELEMRNYELGVRAD